MKKATIEKPSKQTPKAQTHLKSSSRIIKPLTSQTKLQVKDLPLQISQKLSQSKTKVPYGRSMQDSENISLCKFALIL